MAKPAHHRLTFSGVVGTSSAPIEQWSFGLSLSDDATINAWDDLTIDAYASSMKDAYAANIDPIMQATTVLTEVRYACIGADGIHVRTRPDGSYVQGIWTGVDAGGLGAIGMPLEVAIVATFDTARSGPRGRGRIFLPFPAFDVDTLSKRLNDVQAANIAGPVAELIRDVNSAGDPVVSVVSKFGFVSPVTRVRVGRVPDVLRSRRRDAVEGYASVTV